MTDTFFDLQRFAVLVGGQSSFSWEGGENFAAVDQTANVGTKANPAYLAASGGVSTAGTGTEIYLDGERSYQFSLKGKDDWSLKLSGDGTAQVTNGDALALADLDDSAAVLNVNGTFDETVGGNVAYVKSTSATKVTVASAPHGITYDFAKNTAGVDVAVSGTMTNGGAMANFDKGASNIGLGLSKDSIKSGFGFEKSVQVRAGREGEISIYTENNTVTVPGGDVWKVKKASNDNSPEIDYNVANSAVVSVDGIKGATLTSATGVKSDLNVAGTVWNEISGGISSIAFDSVGAAKVENTGAIVARGQAGAKVTIDTLTAAGSTVNGIKVNSASEDDLENVSFTLEEAGDTAGLASVSLKKQGTLTVNKDKAFDVNVGKTSYAVETSADSITFDASASKIEVTVAADKSYDVTGGAATFDFNGVKKATINGAEVSASSGDNVVVNAVKGAVGITNVTGLEVDSTVKVSNDSDGFQAVFNAVEDGDVHIFRVNDVSIRAAGIEGQEVKVSVVGSDVTVTGMTSTDQVSVESASGLTYHFKDGTKDNTVVTTANEAMYVTLDGTGAVTDYMDDPNYHKLKESDANKWDNVASIGNQDANAQPVDNVQGNLSSVFERFYNLGTDSAGQDTIATFDNQNSTVEPSTVANPNGVTFQSRSTLLANDAHVTLSTGSSVGAAPINVQKNENANVVDVVIDQRNSGAPSTIAIGTLYDTEEYDVTASHAIYLSNTGVGYAEIGAYATGQNKIFAGTGGAQIRHDGNRATIVGNTGADTIYAAKNDIVSGGAGADQFYDSASYTITDYDVTQGDALIATRLHSVDEVTKANLNFDADEGNKIGFGTSNKMFTINKDQNAPLLLDVAIMDTDARIVGHRNVAVAGINGGLLDASTFSDSALIVADEYRNGNSGDNVIGTAGNDTIYIGANDTITGSAGNDYITIGGISAGSGDGGAVVAIGEGKNTVAGWNFTFDRNAGATELLAGEGFYGSFENDRLLVTDSNGSMLFDDTKQTARHGEYDVIVNGTKYMAIRTNDENNTNPVSYGEVESNDELADIYIAERAGILFVDSAVTENLGEVVLGGPKYQNITTLTLNNNSKAVVMGSAERETVSLGGSAASGANKIVALGTGNDVIISGGNGTLTAGHELLFGVGDGRDTIRNFSHYLGVDTDPDQQYADTLILGAYGGIYTGTGEDGGTRIEFVTGEESRVFLYEDNGISTDNMYQIQVGADAVAKLAKIGNSNASNTFAYDDKVAYYVGSSADNATDTLTVGNEIANANVWLDGTAGTGTDQEYYRGIAVIDAGAETNTNVALAGNGSNNTLIGGGEGTYNSLWGGAGNNALIGSTSGQDTFYYVRNAGAYLQGVDNTVTGGDDTIYNFDIDNGDIVWLGDTTLDDISSTEVNANSVVVNFKNGGSLTVDGSGDVRFLLNQGTESWVTEKNSESENKWTRE